MTDRALHNANLTGRFWITAIGGFVLGVLTVLLVLMLTRRTGRQEPPAQARPAATGELNTQETSREPIADARRE